MSYQVCFTNHFKHDSKAIAPDRNKKLQDDIKNELAAIIENPKAGEVMKNNMSGLLKHSFGNKPAIRILYTLRECKCANNDTGTVDVDDECPPDQIDNCEGVIVFVIIRTREDCNKIYKQGKKYFQKILKQYNNTL